MKKYASLNKLFLCIDCKTHTELSNTKFLGFKSPKNIRKDGSRLNRIAYIRRLLYNAILSNSKNIAYHQDADGKYSEVYNGIHEDFQYVISSIKNLTTTIKCLAIVPKKMTESWLLADVKAINSLRDVAKPVDQSPDPESLADPKEYLKRNLEKLGVKTDSEHIRIAYSQIAEKAEIEVVKRRCNSFEKFCTDMQSFVTAGNAS
jgi:hypothetical protein